MSSQPVEVANPAPGPAAVPLVLVVDDEQRSLESLRRTLEEEFEVLTAVDAERATEILDSEPVEAVLCDQRMPGESGVSLLQRVRERWPDVVRLIISAYTEPEDVIAGLNDAGIYQYITKPWHPDNLLATVREALQVHRLQQENQDFSLELKVTAPALAERLGDKQRSLRQRFEFDRLVRGPGSPLEDIAGLAARIAGFDINVVITGESGTGKELLARALHYNSHRAAKPFVVQNCGALPDELLESELFGHKRGAFTGAHEDRTGLFARADGGTVFLDEIGEVSSAFQVKLLRVLQGGEIRPLGSSHTQRVDIRVLTATNRDLEGEMREGRFREDLYYRLAGFNLHMPALRGRPGDIPPLARHLLEEAVEQFGKAASGFTDEAADCLVRYPWPGNVRELRNEVQRMLALADDPWLGAELLRPRVRSALEGEAAETPVQRVEDDLGGELHARLATVEKRILQETLMRHRWNKTRAAEELGLSRVGLRGKLRRHGLDGPSAGGPAPHE